MNIKNNAPYQNVLSSENYNGIFILEFYVMSMSILFKIYYTDNIISTIVYYSHYQLIFNPLFLDIFLKYYTFKIVQSKN